jgi:hypothetical protein
MATSSTAHAARGAQGASEYKDVKAAGEYLRSLAQVDPARVGHLRRLVRRLPDRARARTELRHSSQPGVDIHGVPRLHDARLWAPARRSRRGYERLDEVRAQRPLTRPSRRSWASRRRCRRWRRGSSPVLFDPRGRRPQRALQTRRSNLVRRLAAKGVPYEELVIVDDTHHWPAAREPDARQRGASRSSSSGSCVAARRGDESLIKKASGSGTVPSAARPRPTVVAGPFCQGSSLRASARGACCKARVGLEAFAEAGSSAPCSTSVCRWWYPGCCRPEQ